MIQARQLSFTLIFGALLAGCQAQIGASLRPPTDGQPARGAVAITRYSCGSCHQIPGIQEADGLSGPPLDHFARRTVVAGLLPNTADNLELWLVQPQAVVPHNLMPDMGVSQAEAGDIAAYLYTLR